MSDIFDYVRVCIFEKYPANISLSSEYIERHELLGVFQNKFIEILKPFDVNGALPIEKYSEEIFQELESADLIFTLSDPRAGKYYWADLPNVARYMRKAIENNEIYVRKTKLKGDRLYEAVFSNLDPKDGDLDQVDAERQDTAELRSLPRLKAVVSESERAEFRSFLAPIRDEIEGAELSQEEKSDALSALAAIDNLSEAPNPLWQAIVLILSSPIFTNVTSLAALAISILKA